HCLQLCRNRKLRMTIGSSSRASSMADCTRLKIHATFFNEKTLRSKNDNQWLQLHHQMACSTVTVSKCQAALKSLQAFEFFKPTCLCHEPHVDPECNDFRDFLFDHKCIYVNKKEKDPYSIEALPTCNHALSECQRDKSCVKLYDDFKTNCKTRDGRCRMENRIYTMLGKQVRLSLIRIDRFFDSLLHQIRYLCFEEEDEDEDDDDDERKASQATTCPAYSDAVQRLPCLAYGVYSLYYSVAAARKKSPRRARRDGGTRDNVQCAAEREKVGKNRVARDISPVTANNFPFISVYMHNVEISDQSCSNLLQPVLSRCDHSSCARNECLSALEHFYKAAAHKHSLDIAFCLCRKSEGKRDECMMAQEKLHPSCALRAPVGQEKPTCNALATSCRQRPSCRAKLEHYEQNCAVDSVTKKCAGPAQGCRTALLGILGTELRTACDCRGTDFAPIYECLGWQRLLWVNPCVAEAQKDFHARRSRHHGHGRSGTSTSKPATIAKTPRTTTTKTTTTTTQRATWPSVVTPRASLVAATSFESLPEEEVEVEEEERRHEAEDNNVIPDVPTVRSIEESHRFNKESDTASTTTSTTATTTPMMSSTKAPTTTTTTTTQPAPTTPSTTTTSTVPPRFCVYQRPSQSHQQYIREGKGKRGIIFVLDRSAYVLFNQSAADITPYIYIEIIRVPIRT
ncbi:unnamed protein product, partial [Trichogramma brassicae]